ncbi:hypothetical protein [Corynebacterium halotolerans]|uniref:hypothetical protein n=1 Tax=Corynebacterium halotolerans TaxID=225326 RepID=UPI003CFB8D12
MSISHFIDDWFDATGSLPIVEVEPDHECQEFLPEEGVILVPTVPGSGVEHTTTDDAAELVRDLLG